jgi:hypothetical protein
MRLGSIEWGWQWHKSKFALCYSDVDLSYQRRALLANSLSRSRKLDTHGTHIKLTSDMNEIHQLHAILRDGGGLQLWHVEMADSIPLPWTKLLEAFTGSQREQSWRR